MGITLDEFIATLPPALTRSGPARADDVTLAKAIRADLKALATSGLIPVETTFSVRINHYASLHVEFTAWPGQFWAGTHIVSLMDPRVPEPEWRIGQRFVRFTPEFAAAFRAVERIVNRHNYDRSDTMTDHFDVGYYMTVSSGLLEAVATTQLKVETDPKFAALYNDGVAAATSLGDKVVKAVCGGRSIAGATEWQLHRLVKMADCADGRPVKYDKRRGWIAYDDASGSAK